MKKIFKYLSNIFFIFLAWRLFLFIISILAMRFVPFRPSFPYYDSILANLSKIQLIWQWANFDGAHYITIVQKGYIGTGLIQAFFPLYSILIKIFTLINKNPLYVGLLVSNVCFLMALFVFKKILRQEKIKNYWWPILALLLFPTSYYFGALYSESLFLLLTLLSFLFLNKKKWIWAAVFASLASATRLVGVFLGAAIAWEFYSTEIKNKQKLKNYLKLFFLSILSISGFIVFCLYLNKEFHDPFFFAKVQSSFGASRQTDKLILIQQVIWRYIKMLFTVKNNNILLYTISQEFFISLLVLTALIWGWFKNIKKSYLIYAFLSFLLPTLTGNFSSMPRYVSVIFPIYLIFGNVKSRKIQVLILTISGILLIINTALFLRGFWVA